MRRSQAERYAQWALRTATALVVVVAGVYAYRSWQAQQARKVAPPPVPVTVQQQSTSFSFSQKIEGRTLFTIRASKHVQFLEGAKSRLEDVWITIHGRQGQRFDNLHTRECTYEPETGLITCAGEVQIDLESAEEARQRPGERVIHISTRNVSFDRNTGQATTQAPVEFRFPYGHGRCVGVAYNAGEGVVQLLGHVEMTLTSASAGRRPIEPVKLTGNGMEYDRDTRTLRLLPPVRVVQQQRELTAGTLVLNFSPHLRAERLTAGGNPQLVAAEPRGPDGSGRGRLTVSAAEIVALFQPDGWLRSVAAGENARGTWRVNGAEDTFTARRVELELEDTRNLPRLLTATGDVRVTSRPQGAPRPARVLETGALRVAFGPGARPREPRVVSAESLAPATIELAGGDETTRVRSERLTAEFDQRNLVQHLVGMGGAEIERRIGGRPPQITRSREVTMTLGPDGAWTEIEQRGEVRFREDARTAEAQQARFVRATETITLKGNAVVADSLTRTAAPSISIQLRSGEIRAEGGVRTSYLAAERNGITNLAPQPAHISADTLAANRDTGRALYSGRARLWQGDSVIEAAAIELDREARRLDARNAIRAIFPQGVAGKNSERILWRVQAGSLTWWSGEQRVRLEENVDAESQTGRIRARTMDLFLASPEGGAQQLARAVAAGGVTVWSRTDAGPAGQQSNARRGTAERAEYLAAESKFVLSGGNPTLFDAIHGTTSGRQLTFFFADDRILVESDAGTRTLTKYRIEK
jgi:lipopolysaccharide export system protein LptA